MLLSVAVFTRGTGLLDRRVVVDRASRVAAAAPRLRSMNPRYRRLVIPVALGGLILIVVIAALAK